MDAVHPNTPSTPAVQRPEGAMLAHALGNAVAVLLFELENLERHHFNEEKFKEAYDSMSEELALLRDLVVQAARLLQAHSYILKSQPLIASLPDVSSALTPAPPIAPADSSPRIQTPIRVICVDDNVDITAGLRLIIDAQIDMHCEACLATADNLESAVREATAGRPDGPPLIVLLDATMPGKDPLLVTKQLKTHYANTHVIIYSGYDDQAFILRTAAAGACGAISKNDDPTTILRVIREVAAGKTSWPANCTCG